MKVVGSTAALAVVFGAVFTLVNTTGNSPSPTTTTVPPATTFARTHRSSSTTTSTSQPTSTTEPTQTTAPVSTTEPPPTTSTTSTTEPAPSGPPPTSVLVEVFNGSGQTGQATQVSQALKANGFLINGVADAATYTYTSSVILYPPDGLGAAQTLQGFIGGPTTLQESSAVPTSEVQLITGSEFTGVTG